MSDKINKPPKTYIVSQGRAKLLDKTFEEVVAEHNPDMIFHPSPLGHFKGFAVTKDKELATFLKLTYSFRVRIVNE